MRRYIGCVFIFCGFYLASHNVWASTYSKAINESAWAAKKSVFECRLEHSVPFYGDVVFKTRAGEKSVFYLNAKSSRFNAGSAEITEQLPAWYNDENNTATVKLGDIPIKRGKRPLWLSTSWAELIMSRLNGGKEVVIKQNEWFENSNKASELVVTSIGFRQAYREYLNCLGRLIPANFDQLKRTALYFDAGETEELPYSLRRRLDNILTLVKHDKDVKAFYIDGHTDSNGDRADNLALSKARAELVAAYLTKRGVPEDWITVRWHGERYPVATNATRKGQGKNRRVTVRLERIEKLVGLPMGKEAAPGRAASLSNGNAVQ